MSSGPVRAAFRAAMAAGFPALPYYATLGVRVDNNALPDLWVSDDFMPISDNAISIGKPTCHREIGTYRIYVVGKAGDGETAIVDQADLLIDYFRSWRDASGQIKVMATVPPATSDMSDGRWLVVVIDFTFQSDHYV